MFCGATARRRPERLSSQIMRTITPATISQNGDVTAMNTMTLPM